eukprot:Transcript_10740.p1 GENE.Transcript_10740~~Transcript_10740.p1  ORF type:complete len:332 (-),score=136.69 Transcript_10740:142-1137(-)
MPDERRKTKKEKAKAAAGGSLSLTTVAAVFSAIVAAVAVAFAFFLRQASASGGPAELALAPNSFSSTECHEDHYTPRVEDCSPRQCGKVVLDDFASPEETAALLAIAKRGMSMGGGAGGPTIMDMASGALSYEDKFIDVWLAFNLTGRPPFSRSDLAPFKAVTERVAKAVGEHFGATRLWLTAPSFFSRISADRPPKIDNDEYWHSHVDTLQYGSFVYTGLLYLNQAGYDFEGGRLAFDPPPSKGAGRAAGGAAKAAAATAAARPFISPKPGRLVLFSSGAEHPHHVEQVTRGTRYAITIAYTCDERAALQDFLSRAVDEEEAAVGGTGGT